MGKTAPPKMLSESYLRLSNFGVVVVEAARKARGNLDGNTN